MASDYRDTLCKQGHTCNMSRKVDGRDSGAAESLFATLEKELIHRCHSMTREEADLAASAMGSIAVYCRA